MAKVKYKLVFLAVLHDEYDVSVDIQERRTCSRLERCVVVPQGSGAKATAYFDAKTALEAEGWSVFGLFNCDLVGVVPDPDEAELLEVDIDWEDSSVVSTQEKKIAV